MLTEKRRQPQEGLLKLPYLFVTKQISNRPGRGGQYSTLQKLLNLLANGFHNIRTEYLCELLGQNKKQLDFKNLCHLSQTDECAREQYPGFKNLWLGPFLYPLGSVAGLPKTLTKQTNKQTNRLTGENHCLLHWSEGGGARLKVTRKTIAFYYYYWESTFSFSPTQSGFGVTPGLVLITNRAARVWFTG